MKKLPIVATLSEIFRQNINLLLLCLIMFIIIFPCLMGSHLGRDALIAFMVIIMLSGLRALGTGRKEFTRLLWFAVLSPVALTLFLHFNMPYYDIIGMLLSLVFFTITSIRLNSHVMNPEKSNQERLVSALCVYILMGIIWAQVYFIIESLYPGAFNIPSHNDFASLNIAQRFHTLMYCSFMSITTTGYGDITPAIPLTRSLVCVEVITGQFYIAVLIGQLAVAYIDIRRRDEES